MWYKKRAKEKKGSFEFLKKDLEVIQSQGNILLQVVEWDLWFTTIHDFVNK